MRQFFANLTEKNDVSGDDGQFVEEMEEISTHHTNFAPTSDRDEDDQITSVFSNFASIDDDDECASFTALVQDASAIHALTEKTTKMLS